jgi:hypothetical protein
MLEPSDSQEAKDFIKERRELNRESVT